MARSLLPRKRRSSRAAVQPPAVSLSLLTPTGASAHTGIACGRAPTVHRAGPLPSRTGTCRSCHPMKGLPLLTCSRTVSYLLHSCLSFPTRTNVVGPLSLRLPWITPNPPLRAPLPCKRNALQVALPDQALEGAGPEGAGTDGSGERLPFLCPAISQASALYLKLLRHPSRLRGSSTSDSVTCTTYRNYEVFCRNQRPRNYEVFCRNQRPLVQTPARSINYLESTVNLLVLFMYLLASSAYVGIAFKGLYHGPLYHGADYNAKFTITNPAFPP